VCPSQGWVRKNLHIDQRKLGADRKALGVKTETEAVDDALRCRSLGAFKDCGRINDILTDAAPSAKQSRTLVTAQAA
jgi:Arc/MetJ family transcription regulator